MILKFWQGGGVQPPLVSYRPVMGTSTAPQPVAQEKPNQESKADLTDKDLLSLVKDLEGLPNDSQSIVTELQNFYIDEQISPSSTSNIAVRYLQILGRLKVANFSRMVFDAAYDVVNKNGGIDEFAISDRGQLVCVNNEGDFKLFTLEQLKENKDYKPLTNSELLHYRAYSPSMVNKDDILTIVKNGIGMESVTKMIKDIVGTLGTTEDSQEGYGKVKTGQLVQGLEEFAKAVQQASQEQGFDGTIHDLYKFKYLTKTQKDQAEAAISYVYRTLPINAKVLLKTKTDNGTDKEAIQLIETLIAAQINPTRHFDLDLVGGPTAKTSAKSTTSKDGTELSTSLPINVQKAIGGYEQSSVIDRGDGIQLSIKGTYYQQIKTPSGEPITGGSIASMLAESGLQSIVQNIKNITFGDQKLSPEQLSTIVYNNTGILRVNLPVNPDGSVRLSILEDYEKAEAELELLGNNATPRQIADIYKKYGLHDLLNADGTINIKKFAPFIVTEGYGSSNNGIGGSKYVYRVEDPSEQQLSLLESMGGDFDEYQWYNPADWKMIGGGYDRAYKGVIYIPITNNVVAGAYGANQKLDYDEALIQEGKYRRFISRANMNSNSADILNYKYE